MHATIKDASKGKPYTLENPIDNSSDKLTIGIKNIFVWIGWYNIYKEETVRWKSKAEGSTQEVGIKPGLYEFSKLVDILTSSIVNLSITVDSVNGLITMIIPSGVQLWLPDPIRHLFGLDDEGWLDSEEYTGDRAVEFSPKRILIYCKQLSTTNNFESKNQRLGPSQLLGIIPISTKPFGESFTINFENPYFKRLTTGVINELDFDFKVEWGNGVKHKLDNHGLPIDLVLEIKKKNIH